MAIEDYGDTMRIATNYTLEEFIVSADYPELAKRISFNSTQIERTIQLCNYILQPMRDYISIPVHILSGKRDNQLNNAVKGHANSDHLYIPGRRSIACDFTCDNLGLAWEWLVNERDLFKMIILYEGSNFIHISGIDNSPIRSKIKVTV